MSGDVHVRFCESRGVRFPPATHLVIHCDTEAKALHLWAQPRNGSQAICARSWPA